MSPSGPVIAARAATLAGAEVTDVRRLAGGNLSEVMLLHLADGRDLVAKSGPTARAEADMLRAIAATGAPAPTIVGVENGLFVMRAVAAEDRLGGTAWSWLAIALARLHDPADEDYGWNTDHAFGSVAISNARCDDWVTFWAERRLRCHAPYVDTQLARRLEALADRLGDIVPAHPPPVLLHGDLWGGNVLVGRDGVTLIDPACYYGDREVDIAMLALFDHPPRSFFDALRLEAGWRERQPVYRLWPLLVHLRLFGSGYRLQVDDMLGRLGA